MRRFFPFAALLGVAFVLGCQDLGTGPVEPYGLGPQFAKKKCKDTDHPPPCGKDDKEPTVDGTFTATFPSVVNAIEDVTGGGVLFGPQGGKELISGGGRPANLHGFPPLCGGRG